MSRFTAIALNCSLKAEGPSNTEVLLRQVLDELESHDVTTDLVRVAAHTVNPACCPRRKVPTTSGRRCANASWPPTS